MQLNHEFKGFPTGHVPVALSDVGALGWQVLRGDLPLPLAVLQEFRQEISGLDIPGDGSERHLEDDILAVTNA